MCVAKECFDALSGGFVEPIRRFERAMELNTSTHQRSISGLTLFAVGKFASLLIADLIQRSVQSLEQFLNALSGGLY